MKKLLIIMLIGSLCMLSACVAPEKAKVTEKKDKTKDEDTVIEIEEVSLTEEEFTIGNTEGYVYENAFFNTRLEVDSSWYIASEDELASFQEMAIDNFDDESLRESFDNGETAYVFYAERFDGTGSIQIMVGGLGLENLKAEQVLELSLSESIPNLEAAGISVKSHELVDVEIDGRSEKAIDMTILTNGVEVYQKQIMIIKGKYLIDFVLTGSSPEAVDEQISYISYLD